MTTNAQDAGDAVARTHPRHWIGINAEDIPQGWIDDMVKRLFEELNRQILRVENAQHADPRGNATDAPGDRERDSRTLERLQKSLDRLIGLDAQRASLRATKSARKPKDVRREIQRKLLAQLKPGSALGDGGESR